MDKSRKNRHFFQDNNAIKKRERQAIHNNTDKIEKIFIEYFLRWCVNKEEFYNKGFIFDAYSFG